LNRSTGRCLPSAPRIWPTSGRMNWIATALIGGSLILPPFLAGDFYINLASQILIAAIFALSLNLLVGFGGMTSLGLWLDTSRLTPAETVREILARADEAVIIQ